MTCGTIHQLLVFSLYLLLLLATGIAVLAYLVSPLHDPSFLPTSANAGATIDWLRPEKYWMVLIYTFSIALPTNLTVLAWLWLLSQNRRLTIDRDFQTY